MGSPKALLPLQGRSFVSVLVRAFLSGGCDPVIVVAGPEGDADAHAIAAEARSLGARIAINANRDSAQIESLRAALRILPPEVSAVIVSPVDSPGADARLVEKLIEAAGSGAPIVVPTAGGRRGHPILFSGELFAELLADDLAEGARTVIRRHERALVEFPVAGRDVLLDVDTPEDYRRLQEERA